VHRNQLLEPLLERAHVLSLACREDLKTAASRQHRHASRAANTFASRAVEPE
jgi:hypothetical protein